MKPFLTHPIRWLVVILPIMLGASHIGLSEWFSSSAEVGNEQVSSGGDEIFIHHIPPDKEGGHA
ncbi:MAG: hypothetical protein K9L59_07920 [Desulfobacterales bacterium]|nr:hypothetical protein [Desulfobacterales bacterium]